VKHKSEMSHMSSCTSDASLYKLTLKFTFRLRSLGCSITYCRLHHFRRIYDLHFCRYEFGVRTVFGGLRLYSEDRIRRSAEPYSKECGRIRRTATVFEGVQNLFGGLRTIFGGLRTVFEGVQNVFGGLRTIFGGLRTVFEGVRNRIRRSATVFKIKNPESRKFVSRKRNSGNPWAEIGILEIRGPETEFRKFVGRKCNSGNPWAEIGNGIPEIREPKT
jgi:hypothetical protein